jgi:hypothetical protein
MNKKHIFTIFFMAAIAHATMINSCLDCLKCCLFGCYNDNDEQQGNNSDLSQSANAAILAAFAGDRDSSQVPDFDQNSNKANRASNADSNISQEQSPNRSLYQNPGYGSCGFSEDGFRR